MIAPNDAASALMSGSSQWRKWQHNNPDQKLIRGLDLGQVDHSGLVLEGYTLDSCFFELTKLDFVNFNKCVIQSCKFLNVDLRQSSFNNSEIERTGFVKSKMRRCGFSGAVLTDVKLSEVDLCEATLQHIKGVNVIIKDSKMSGVNLYNCDMSRFYCTNVEMESANLSQAKLIDAHMPAAIFRGTDFNSANLSGANFNGASFSPADPSNPKGTRCILSEAVLVGTVFQSADLRSVDFSQSVLSGANLRSASVDAWTRFDDCPPPTDMQIDRHLLETLADDYGGFTRGHRMVMKVFDDASLIRRQFSGVYRLTHSLALVVFLLPYAWFLVMRWRDASFEPKTGKSMMIIEAFLRFVLTGDERWRNDWAVTWSFGLFIVAIIYNAVRLYFLKTTLDLEMHERVYGLPAQFTLTGFRAVLYGALRYGFWLYLIVIMCNTTLFLMRKFPIL